MDQTERTAYVRTEWYRLFWEALFLICLPQSHSDDVIYRLYLKLIINPQYPVITISLLIDGLQKHS